MKQLLIATLAVFAFSAPAMAAGSNPVFYDPATGLYYKEKGKPVPVDGVSGSKGDKGDKGDTGPAGPQGEQGIAGADGKDGQDGVNGKDGRDGTDGAPGERGERGEQGVAGVDGKDGKDGVNGQNGQDGRDGRDAPGFDRKSYAADLAATAGIGGIELRKGGKGVTSWSAGLGAVKSQGGTGKAIAFGLHHGISDNWGVYAKVSRSIGGGRSSTAAFVGVEGQF